MVRAAHVRLAVSARAQNLAPVRPKPPLCCRSPASLGLLLRLLLVRSYSRRLASVGASRLGLGLEQHCKLRIEFECTHTEKTSTKKFVPGSFCLTRPAVGAPCAHASAVCAPQRPQDAEHLPHQGRDDEAGRFRYREGAHGPRDGVHGNARPRRSLRKLPMLQPTPDSLEAPSPWCSSACSLRGLSPCMHPLHPCAVPIRYVGAATCSVPTRRRGRGPGRVRQDDSPRGFVF